MWFLKMMPYVLMLVGLSLFCIAHIMSWTRGTTLKKNLESFNREHAGRQMSFIDVVERARSNSRDTSLMLGFQGILWAIGGFILYLIVLFI